MVSILRILSAAAAVPAVAGLALAAPAQADPPLLNGSYTEVGGDPLDIWTFGTNCGATGCAGTVASTKGWTTTAASTNGLWAFTISKPGGLICDDGSYQPAVASVSVDPVTLQGVLSSDSNFGCEGGAVTRTPIQLQKVS